MFVYKYIQRGLIWRLTPTVVMVARTMAKIMVMITSKKTADSATCFWVEMRMRRKIRKGIDTTI